MRSFRVGLIPVRLLAPLIVAAVAVPIVIDLLKPLGQKVKEGLDNLKPKEDAKPPEPGPASATAEKPAEAPKKPAAKKSAPKAKAKPVAKAAPKKAAPRKVAPKPEAEPPSEPS